MQIKKYWKEKIAILMAEYLGLKFYPNFIALLKFRYSSYEKNLSLYDVVIGCFGYGCL
jgi:hypothetical protein